MVTVGGAISGYCAIGRMREAISPASVMMIAMTDAKIGRWMKNRDICSLLLRGGGSACGLRFDRPAHARLHVAWFRLTRLRRRGLGRGNGHSRTQLEQVVD